MKLLLLLLSLLCISSLITAEYIVFSTIPEAGHITPMIPLAQELRERGHHVAFTFFDDELHYIEKYNFPHISLGAKSPLNKTRLEEITAYMCQNPTDSSALLLSVKEHILGSYGPVFNKFNESFRRPNEKPDLIVTDFVGLAASDIGRIHKIPVVMLVHSMEILASFIPPAPHLPGFLSGKLYVEYPTLWEQLENLVSPYLVVMRIIPLIKAMAEERGKYGVKPEHMPYAQLIMTSVWGYEIPRAIPATMQLVGNMWPVEDPNEEWHSETAIWLDGSETPVLYVSLGSMVLISEEQLRELFEGIKLATTELGIRVLWILRKNQKGREEIISQVLNEEKIRIEAWGEQRKILSHKKVFCFLSHGGQNSISESLARGKPLIIMPFFADQLSNAALVVYSSTGTNLSPQGWRREEVVNAVRHMRENNEKYKKGAERIAVLMKAAGGAKRAADISEQTMKVGVAHLFHPKDNTSILINVIPYLLFTFVFILLFKVLKFIVRLFFRLFQKDKKVKKA